jgi:hypothetical protein
VGPPASLKYRRVEGASAPQERPVRVFGSSRLAWTRSFDISFDMTHLVSSLVFYICILHRPARLHLQHAPGSFGKKIARSWSPSRTGEAF